MVCLGVPLSIGEVARFSPGILDFGSMRPMRAARKSPMAATGQADLTDGSIAFTIE